jgi:peroxiredoxin
MRASAPLVLACALALAGCRGGPETREPDGRALLQALALPAVGPAAEDARELGGRVLLVAFFATWCFPCVAEVPTLQALQRDYGPRGFRVVGVGMDLEGARVLAPFADEYALNYPMLVADDALRAGRSAFGSIRALPTTFLLDREGRVLAAWQGMAGHEDVAAAIEKALAR